MVIPSVNGFNGMVGKYILDKCQFHAEMSEAIKLWTSQEGWKTIHLHIRHCRVSKMFLSANKRLEVSCPGELHTMALFPNLLTEAPKQVESLTPTWAYLVIRAEFRKSSDCKSLEGIAPPGDLERKIQDWLDKEEGKK